MVLPTYQFKKCFILYLTILEQCNSSDSFMPIFLKLHMCCLHGLWICMGFGYNPEIIFCRLFHIVFLVFFRPQMLSKYIDSVNLSSTTLFYTTSGKYLLAKMSRITTKPTKWHVRPAKTQISPVWSDCSLSALRKFGSLVTLWAHSEDWSDSSLGAHVILWVCPEAAQMVLSFLHLYSMWGIVVQSAIVWVTMKSKRYQS